MTGSLFSSPSASVARVALPVPVDRLFDYAVPPHLAREAEPGRRVRVAMGGRTLVGLLVEEVAETAEERRGRLRPLLAVLDPEPALSAALMELVIQEARDVLCPVGIALAAALPPGSTPRSARGFALTPRGRAALASGALREGDAAVLEALSGGPLSEASLRRRMRGADPGLAALERDRWIERMAVEEGPRVRPATTRIAHLAPGVDAESVCRATLARAPRQAELLRELAAAGPAPVARLLAADAGRAAALRALRQRGLVRIEAVPATLENPLCEEAAPPVVLTAEQGSACEAVGEAIRERRPERFLLHGVTGSGKTEVYLRAVAEALDLGRQALVLVPEITLTHQIIGRLRARFGDRLAVLHSRLRPGERLAQWQRLRRGETPIAVGARSALFAPTRDLGVIVVDEEHDAAYKNEEGFRYHARRLAARRARVDGCPLVLGSATPSLESRHAAEQGALRRLRLSHRVASRPLPAVTIVDLARERAALPRGRKLILSPPLLRALGEALSDGAQAILFLNRRGFSTQITCFECGYVARCKHCDIALTYHAAAGWLRCHYCDHHAPPPDACPSCGAAGTALLGIGTERVEEEVRLHFPEARVGRLDRDAAARRGATEEILRELRAGGLDVLVGTQMVAKGHDFPGVRLVGVVNADLGLHLPDFRAAERTFQLLTQVAGRAGRGATPGRVVVQTFSPDHYAIRPVATHDYERFYAEEMRHRSALGYPPVGHLAQVKLDGPDEGRVRAAASVVADAAREAAQTSGGCEVLGPAPAPIGRLRGRYRFQLLVKHRERRRLLAIARRVLAATARLGADVRASVDVNPYDML